MHFDIRQLYGGNIQRGDRGQLRIIDQRPEYQKSTLSFTGTDGRTKIDGFIGTEFSVNKTHILTATLGTDSEHNGY